MKLLLSHTYPSQLMGPIPTSFIAEEHIFLEFLDRLEDAKVYTTIKEAWFLLQDNFLTMKWEVI